MSFPAGDRSNPPLTVVMYHYVRPIKGSRHYRIRGLELVDFEAQIDYIERHYSVVSMDAVLDAASGRSSLPPSPLLLTFDDGYRDHHEHVFPVLKRRKLSGAFFPPVQAVREGRILDVNKVHYILAALDEPQPFVDAIDAAIGDASTEAGLLSAGEYRKRYMLASRFDTAATMYVKRMLQFGLPTVFRGEVLDELFARYVSSDEVDFASQLYVSEDQLRDMVDAGMAVGGHGYSHSWLNRLAAAEQAFEIDRSLAMLQSLGATDRHFIFCYPYGGYDERTLALLRDRGCDAAFTTRLDLAKLGANDLLELPRIDTNDLPVTAESGPVSWTVAAAKGTFQL